MKISVNIVFALVLIASATAQDRARPDENCDELVLNQGKSYSQIYVPHGSNCQKFYQCTDHGLVELKCNQGLVFFPYINGCVLRTKDNCITYSQWKSLNV